MINSIKDKILNIPMGKSRDEVWGNITHSVWGKTGGAFFQQPKTELIAGKVMKSIEDAQGYEEKLAAFGREWARRENDEP